MSIVLYTPGQLIADSRVTSSSSNVVSDEQAKLRCFHHEVKSSKGKSKKKTKHHWMPYKGDQVYVGGGAGSSPLINTVFRAFKLYGDEAQKHFAESMRLLGGELLHRKCRILLVGKQHLYCISINASRTNHWKEETLPLDTPFAIGSGCKVAMTLHHLLGIDPMVAVATTPLLCSCCGGDIVSVALPKKKGDHPLEKTVWKSDSTDPEHVKSLLTAHLCLKDMKDSVEDFQPKAHFKEQVENLCVKSDPGDDDATFD